VVRLSFAVRPPAEVSSVVAAMPRPQMESALWSMPQRWIVKLRPLGHVPAQLRQPLVDAVEAALDGAGPVRATLRSPLRRFGGQRLCAPVEGLDDLAAAVFEATEPLVPVTHPQPFHADLVLAGGRIPQHLEGTDLRAEWIVTEVLLVADRSSPRATRLQDLATIVLTD
jgi:hypothetical protein